LTICKNKVLRPFSQSWPVFPILSRKFFRRNMQRRQNAMAQAPILVARAARQSEITNVGVASTM
jgi:hypothetical protein